MKRSRIKEMTMEVTVGVVMFMILLTLGVFTIVLSRENIFRKTYPIHIMFPTVMGLNEGDNVVLRGVRVGTVKLMEVRTNGVFVVANLNYEPKFHEDYEIEVMPSSVLGGRYLNLNEGTSRFPYIPEDTVLDGKPPVDLMGQAAGTILSVRKALDEGGILKNLESTMANFNDVSAKLSKGEGTLGKLIADDTLYTQLQQISTDLKTVSEQLAQGQGTLGKLLMDDTIYNDLRTVSSDFKKVSDDLAQGRGTLGKLLTEDDMYTKVDAIASDIKVITERMANGEGTLGKLSSDSGLYDDIKLLVDEARTTLDDIRETSPIVSFSSIFFGAF
ncbi:MAG: MCE family protein [Spartobacteria bacterium]|nr:MCE family protein [Spartobacteria bacterium]